MQTLSRTLVLALAWLALSSAAQPVTTYTSFGPGNTFNISSGWLVDGTQNPPEPYVGESFAFTPSVSGHLSQLDLVLSANHDLSVDLANVSLALNSSRNLPGTVLESFLNTPCGGYGGLSHPITSLSSSANPLLQAGATYWLCVEPSSPNAALMVNQNTQGLLARQAQETSPTAWFFTANRTTFAFDVEVVVPEPPTGALAALGLLALCPRRSGPLCGLPRR